MNYFSNAARLIGGRRSRDRAASIFGVGAVAVAAVLVLILVESRWQSYFDRGVEIQTYISTIG